MIAVRSVIASPQIPSQDGKVEGEIVIWVGAHSPSLILSVIAGKAALRVFLVKDVKDELLTA
jgi:hypothetical protein